MLAHNGQDRRRAGIHCPAALNLYRVQRLTKDITVQINKQGPVPIAIGIRPARMKHNIVSGQAFLSFGTYPNISTHDF